MGQKSSRNKSVFDALIRGDYEDAKQLVEDGYTLKSHEVGTIIGMRRVDLFKIIMENDLMPEDMVERIPDALDEFEHQLRRTHRLGEYYKTINYLRTYFFNKIRSEPPRNIVLPPDEQDLDVVVLPYDEEGQGNDIRHEQHQREDQREGHFNFRHRRGSKLNNRWKHKPKARKNQSKKSRNSSRKSSRKVSRKNLRKKSR